MKGIERKKEKKKEKASGDSPKVLSEYQKGRASKQDGIIDTKSKL
ncbi:hypothetical protein AGMMS49574_25230 [Bacteroidia bacterium]|nr:hypothetical protein AGMMS49574_25230 [Bacteroidia bacterium]